MTLAVIPSRYGSSRFKGKPLALIAGKPMIQRVYEQASKAEGISRVVVATDDHRIIKAVEAFGGEALMTSDRHRSGTDRVAEVANALKIAPQDIVVNIQGDQPVFSSTCLDAMLAPFKKEPGLVMSTLAFKFTNFKEITDPTNVKVIFDRNGHALYFSRAQIPFPRDGQNKDGQNKNGQNRDRQKDVDYFKHLGFYAYTKEFLDLFSQMPQGTLEKIEKLEQLRVLEQGYSIRVVITKEDSPGVDIPRDIQHIESFLKMKN